MWGPAFADKSEGRVWNLCPGVGSRAEPPCEVGRGARGMGLPSDPPRLQWVGRLTNLGLGGSRGLVETTQEHFLMCPKRAYPAS